MALILGILLLVLLTAAAAAYTAVRPIDRYDRAGGCVFFIAAGLPLLVVALSLIAHSVMVVPGLPS